MEVITSKDCQGRPVPIVSELRHPTALLVFWDLATYFWLDTHSGGLHAAKIHIPEHKLLG